MHSLRRIHSTISGNEVAPVRSKQREGAVAAMARPREESAELPRITNLTWSNCFTVWRTTSAKCSTGQRLFFQRAPGWRATHKDEPGFHRVCKLSATEGREGSQLKSE